MGSQRNGVYFGYIETYYLKAHGRSVYSLHQHLADFHRYSFSYPPLSRRYCLLSPYAAAGFLGPYAPATPAPVLTSRVVLPGTCGCRYSRNGSGTIATERFSTIGRPSGNVIHSHVVPS
eukprot:956220-Rhodomonas_salina.1